MNTVESLRPITFPARPINGGLFDKARPKRGQWLYEPKFNGWRALVHIPTGTMFNRHGERLSIQEEFAKALTELRGEVTRSVGKDFVINFETRETRRLPAVEWADVEALERRHNRGRGSLIVLDFPELKLPLKERGFILRGMFCPAIDHCAANDTVYSVPQFTDGATTWESLKRDNQMLGCEFYEGMVAKRADALYPIQLLSPKMEFSYWMKHRWRF